MKTTGGYKANNMTRTYGSRELRRRIAHMYLRVWMEKNWAKRFWFHVSIERVKRILRRTGHKMPGYRGEASGKTKAS